MDLPAGQPRRRGWWLTAAACILVLAAGTLVTVVAWPAAPDGPAATATEPRAGAGAWAAAGATGGTAAGAGAAGGTAAGAAHTQLSPDALAGSPAIGAIFSTTAAGRLQAHFCTASVIDSPEHNLLITAAHCVAGYSDVRPAHLAFVPGFFHGTAPFGIWTVTRIFADAAWTTSADPDHDVAFLTVRKPGSMAEIQDVTGGQRLGVGLPPDGNVRVIGYPGTSSQPISCQNRVSAFGPSQMRFDCDSFTNGTSGSPFLIDVDAATGEGTVIGVIGGYQEGGNTPDISYAATFGSAVQALYDTAVAGS